MRNQTCLIFTTMDRRFLSLATKIARVRCLEIFSQAGHKLPVNLLRQKLLVCASDSVSEFDYGIDGYTFEPTRSDDDVQGLDSRAGDIF